MKLIGMSGLAGSGKDTCADFLCKAEGFVKLSLAAPLKEMCSKVFGIEAKYFDDRKLKEAEFETVMIDYCHLDKIRDIVENEWGFVITHDQREKMESYYGREIKTPRKLLQTIGTDILRTIIRDDIWIVLLFSQMKDLGSHIIVSDVRFKNEREAFKKAGAVLMLVKRDAIENKDGHSSENDLGTEKDYDVVINNSDITLNQLRSEVTMWYAIKEKYR